ncbi:SGNH hydrolase domain-containing protein [Ramlibacter sp. WS9]|uniref:SGNH hydrolase domain-containing protein n=1 Tax=Ramlibacter sp. WS9 TaxID=1882741 RepID=UPI001142F487|nr:SGNH hydrolase domain-containing protein [Ramlibacter sp. WS9]ROZ79062.1 hypothetical protein EEB15_05125 [Ramlibacter sp. WS9]
MKLPLRFPRTARAGLLAVALAVCGAPAHAGPSLSPAIAKAFEPPERSAECFDIAHAHDKPEAWLCRINPSSRTAPSFVLFGDSHALQLLGAFDAAARQAGRSGVFTGYSGCVPLLGVYPLTRPDQAVRNCAALNLRMLDHVGRSGIKDVFLVAKWSYYTDMWQGTSYLNAIGLAPGEEVSVRNSRRAFEQGVLDTVKAYRALGVRLHIVPQVPQQMLAPEQAYTRAMLEQDGAAARLRALSVPRARHAQLQAFAGSVFARAVGGDAVRIMNFDDLFCDAEVCLIGTPAASYYQDPSHLSGDGAARLVPALARALSAKGPTSR